MPKGLQVGLALLGPCLDLVGAVLLSAYIVAGSEKMENILQSLKKFSYDLAMGASNLIYRDAKGMEGMLEAPISKTPGVAASVWFLSPFVISALIIAPLFFPLIGATLYSVLLFGFAILVALGNLGEGVRLAIFALSIFLLLAVLFYFIPLETLVSILFVPVVFLIPTTFILSFPLSFTFLVRWTVEKEQEKRVSLLGLLLLLSGFVVQGAYNVTTLD